jgi:hypothetical protein
MEGQAFMTSNPNVLRTFKVLTSSNLCEGADACRFLRLYTMTHKQLVGKMRDEVGGGYSMVDGIDDSSPTLYFIEYKSTPKSKNSSALNAYNISTAEAYGMADEMLENASEVIEGSPCAWSLGWATENTVRGADYFNKTGGNFDKLHHVVLRYEETVHGKHNEAAWRLVDALSIYKLQKDHILKLKCTSDRGGGDGFFGKKLGHDSGFYVHMAYENVLVDTAKQSKYPKKSKPKKRLTCVDVPEAQGFRVVRDVKGHINYRKTLPIAQLVAIGRQDKDSKNYSSLGLCLREDFRK